MEKILHKIAHLIQLMVHNEFFTAIQTANIAEEQWRRMFLEKYGSVGFFVPFLETGAQLCRPHDEQLSKVFWENWQDEVGIIDEACCDACSHETWRLRSLRAFGITWEHAHGVRLLPSTQVHSDLLGTLAQGEDFLEHCGALLFLEVWIAREMTELIKAFERTMPNQFPVGGYDKTKIPMNTHEYWYNHRDHDPEHFRLIKEAVSQYLEKNDSLEVQARILKGVYKAYFAKQILYSKDLLGYMLT